MPKCASRTPFSQLGPQEHYLLWIENQAAGCEASCFELALSLDNIKPGWDNNFTFSLGLRPPRIISKATTGDFSPPPAAKRGMSKKNGDRYVSFTMLGNSVSKTSA